MHESAIVLGPLAAVWLISGFTPGPNFFATMCVAARHGRRAALTTIATRFQKWLSKAAGAVFVGFALKLAIDR